MELLVVVPAYNEEKKIASVIQGLVNSGYANVLVVDDGSSDQTADVARRSGAKVVKHLVNRGQGAGLETGDSYARSVGAKYVVHFDGDDQFDANDIAPALNVLKEQNLDVVLGSRFLKYTNDLPLTKKYFILPLARVVNYLFTGVWLTDAHNGFRVLNTKALNSLTIEQRGMAHNSELIAGLREHKLRYAEVPITVRYHRYGQGLGGGIRVILDLIKSWFL